MASLPSELIVDDTWPGSGVTYGAKFAAVCQESVTANGLDPEVGVTQEQADYIVDFADPPKTSSSTWNSSIPQVLWNLRRGAMANHMYHAEILLGLHGEGLREELKATGEAEDS